jgi:predicted transcriptional regulator
VLTGQRRRGASVVVVCNVMQTAFMAKKTSAITVRVSDQVKARLATRARRKHRSLSGQIAHELERLVAAEPLPGAARRRGRLMGSSAGGPVPTDEDIREVRRMLWGRLPRPERRAR